MSDAPGSCAGDDEVVAIVSCAIAPGLATARALGVHNNTIYHRLNRVQTLTGLDPRTYRGLCS
ncbi:MAG: PucR C-terminal helix-turn-helix domain [Gammaproteobacteria bacterium]|nr:PucR C-terminal helix-turn-helix domain [Gammaproteobacteria bacterium]